MPSKTTLKVRAFVQAALYWLGWAALFLGCAEVLTSRVLVYVGSHLAVSAWWGTLSLAVGAFFKILRWAIPVITAALTKEAQKPGLNKKEVILAVALAVMSGASGLAMPDMAMPVGVVVGDVVTRPADVIEVACPADVIETVEVVPDATWDAPAPVQQDAGKLDASPGVEVGPVGLIVEWKPVA
jgi:hypothetical protein